MSAPNDSGPAFPVAHVTGKFWGMNGMTLRDWFAGQALNGMLASGHWTTPAGHDDEPWFVRAEHDVLDKDGEETGKTRLVFCFPSAAYRVSDAMLAERAKGAK